MILVIPLLNEFTWYPPQISLSKALESFTYYLLACRLIGSAPASSSVSRTALDAVPSRRGLKKGTGNVLGENGKTYVFPRLAKPNEDEDGNEGDDAEEEKGDDEEDYCDNNDELDEEDADDDNDEED